MLVKQIEEQKIESSVLVKTHIKERNMPISLIAHQAMQGNQHIEDEKNVKDKNK